MSHPVATSYRSEHLSRRSPRTLDQRGESVAGPDDAAPDSYFPIARTVEQWTRGHWLRFVAARPAGEHPLANRCLRARRGRLTARVRRGARPPPAVSHELRSWPTKRPDAMMPNNTVKSHLAGSTALSLVAGRARAFLQVLAPVHHGPGRVAAARGPAPRAARNPYPPTTRRRAQRQPDSFGVMPYHRPPTRGSLHQFVLTPLVIRHRTPR
jgi:hypothetical protein